MGKISLYDKDTEVVGDDKWIGTDSQNHNFTKNFTAQKVADFLNNTNRIDSADLHYRYQDKLPVDDREPGTISFPTSIGDIVPFSSISGFMLSQSVLGSNKDVSSFYTTPLVGNTVMISKGDDISQFGIYNWISSTQNVLELDFYNISLTYIDGNGDMEADENYVVSILSYGGGGDKNYVFDQTTSSSVWTINHTLNKFPSVSVVDSAGTEVFGQVDYISLSQITITFTAGFTGQAFLN